MIRGGEREKERAWVCFRKLRSFAIQWQTKAVEPLLAQLWTRGNHMLCSIVTRGQLPETEDVGCVPRI